MHAYNVLGQITRMSGKRKAFFLTGLLTINLAEDEPVNYYSLVHQTIVTPRQTMAIPIHRFRLMRSPRKAFAPRAPAA
jgi:hypothetical protein